MMAAASAGAATLNRSAFSKERKSFMAASSVSVSMPSDVEIVVTREFNAPRKLVWDAHVKPELMRRWCSGPDGWTVTACESDPRPGGKIYYAWQHDDGREMSMRGEYREVQPHERIVHTERFEFGCDMQSGEQLVTTLFVEKGDRTQISLTLRFPNREARDGMVASGATNGMEQSYQRLDAILAESR
jgi:uncharacterized protein YndB with AHSA1/START domain